MIDDVSVLLFKDNMIELSKELGRPLNEAEAEEFRIKYKK